MNEFELINQYFKSDYIGDDAAIISLKPDHELIASTDTLVEGRHFLPTDLPQHIAHKALAVNLSDVAAMGAKPVGFLLALTLPSVDESWLSAFSQSLFELSDRYAAPLLGGDTTKGPLSITITALGQAPQGGAIKRSGAQSSDSIFVSGELGASALVVKHYLHKIVVPATELYEIIPIYQKPTPQLELGQRLAGIATSAIDISDGLAQDCQHILEQSNVGAQIHLENIPMNSSVKRTLSPEKAQHLVLTGGDDYQLLFTVPSEQEDTIIKLSSDLNIPIAKIGKITPGHQLILLKDGEEVDWDLQGWDHFSS